MDDKEYVAGVEEVADDPCAAFETINGLFVLRNLSHDPNRT